VNTTMIEVALGMALMYAVLSMFVTTIQELVVNSHMRWRGRHMRKTVQSAFGEDAALTEAFFKHPLIVSLSDGKGGRAPSYIPEDIFAKVFLSVLGRGTHPKTLGLTPAGFMASLTPTLATTPNATGTQPALGAVGSLDFVESLRLATTDSAGLRGGAGGVGEWPAFEADVAHWFCEITERSRGWFKRSSQRWTFAIALVVAVGLNVDSVMIARTLWGDSELRKQLADAAVAVDAARRTAASDATATPRAVANAGAKATPSERYRQVEDGLQQMLLRLRDPAFYNDEVIFTLTCEQALASECQNDTIVGKFEQHCRGAGPLPVPPASAAASVTCARPAAAAARKKVAPAQFWLDQTVDLINEMAAGRDAAAPRGKEFLLSRAGVQDRLARVQRTLEAIRTDMESVRSKTADPNGKASRTIGGLITDIRLLQDQIGALFRLAPPESARARSECRLQFPADDPRLEECALRRQAEQPFPLPMGFEPLVISRQMSVGDLDHCSEAPGKCSTFDQLLRAGMNGAILGWLLTAVALSLGAPFWFDTLGRLVKLRGAGTRPEDTEEGKPAGAKAPAPPPPGGGAGSAGSPPPPPPPSSGTTDASSKIEATLSTDEIREVQKRLQVPTTGFFDDATRTKIQARRAQLGMGAGAELDGALYEAIIQRRSPSVAERPTLKPGDTHALVPELRDRVTALLGIPSRAQGSGDQYDDKLRAAVRLLQGRAGLVPDGVVGELTWRVIDSGGGAPVAADQWMSQAIAQLGLDETKDAADVQEFLKVLNQAGPPAQLPWCACFVAWVVRFAGAAPPPANPAGALSWQNWGKQDNEGKYGSVILLQEKNVRVGVKPQAHVAMLVGKSATGWVVLGGNQGAQGTVSVTQFPSDSHEMLWCARPV